MSAPAHTPGATRFDEWLLNKHWRSSKLTAAPSGLQPVPGDGGIPLIGHSLEALRLRLDFGLKRYTTYGPVSWMRVFGLRIVGVAGGEATQLVLANKDKTFTQQ